jgi:hypothetical protein
MLLDKTEQPIFRNCIPNCTAIMAWLRMNNWKYVKSKEILVPEMIMLMGKTCKPAERRTYFTMEPSLEISLFP